VGGKAFLEGGACSKFCRKSTRKREKVSGIIGANNEEDARATPSEGETRLEKEKRCTEGE